MKQLLVVVLVLVVAGGVVGYWRGWFGITDRGKVEVQTDGAKFKLDRDAFGKSVGEKARAMKEKVAGLRKKSEGLKGESGSAVQKELGDLQEKHDRLEMQLRELEEAGPDRFESLKRDLATSIEEVEKKIEDLTKKLEKLTVN